MTIYRTNFEDFYQDPGLTEMLQALERAFARFKVHYYLVGAVSRDIWMSGIHKIRSGRATRDIDMDGFKEVYDTGLPEIEIAGRHRFQFCTLPGLILLKLIAWDDRPEARRDDIIDISELLSHFSSMQQELIWDQHNDLYLDDDNTEMDIVCIVVGREMQTIAYRSPKLYQRILRILEESIRDPSTSAMARIMVQYFDNTVEENIRLLKKMSEWLSFHQFPT